MICVFAHLDIFHPDVFLVFLLHDAHSGTLVCDRILLHIVHLRTAWNAQLAFPVRPGLAKFLDTGGSDRFLHPNGLFV